MFAELAAITSALGAINSTISTLKDAKDNANDVSRLISKFSGASDKLNEWERKKKLKRPLTTKEAMDLTLARRQIAQTERNLADICLMSGCADVWREAQRLKAQSEQEQRAFLATINKKRKARKQKFQAIMTAFFLVAALVFMAWGGYTVYEGIRQAQLDKKKTRVEERRRQLRNIRQCGRVNCG